MPDLLLSFAHPDDETFGPGATVARYAGRGVALVCATRGEGGRTTGLDEPTRDEIARVRERELREAARILGIGEVEILGHADGKVPDADADVLTGTLVAAIRRHRPRVVLTFGPEGAPNGHRDHRAVSRATTAAFFLARVATAFPEHGAPHSAGRLCYLTWEPPRPGDELQLLGQPIDIRIAAEPTRDAKWRAFLAHASQRHHEARFRSLSLERDEFFHVAAGATAKGDDLFEGV